MRTTVYSTHDATRSVIETLRHGLIRASIAELRERDKMTLALRSALRNGVPIDDLSEASGLSCSEIRRRVDGELALGEDVASLAGQI